MSKLMRSEFKKIFMIKTNIIIIIIAIIGTMAFAYLKYIEYDDSSYHNQQYANLEGDQISGIQVAQYADKLLHANKGEWNQETFDRLDTEFERLLNQFPNDEIDEVQMKKYYGENYMELVNHVKNGTLTSEVIGQYFDNNNISMSITVKIDNKDIEKDTKFFDIILYYKNDAIRNLIGKSFINTILSRYSDEENALKNNEGYKRMISLFADKKVEGQEGFELETLQRSGLTHEEIKLYYDYLLNQSEKLPTTFDSSLPNEMLVLTLSSTLWIGIVVIMIVLANTFGMERHYNMEQLIYPTKKGKFKITIAKIITGILFSIMMMGIVILSCFIVSWIILPVHTWNMPMAGSVSSSAFTYSYFFTYMFLLAITTAIATGVLTMALSYLTKNQFVVIVGMFLFMVSGFPLSQSQSFPDIVLSVLPYNMAIFTGYFEYPQFNFPYAFINNQVIPLRDVSLIVWVILFIIICGLIIIHSRKQRTRN